MDLRGKKVLVTGAGRGMGRLEAKGFAREGARVIVTDIDAAALEETMREMREEGFDVSGHVFDVSKREECFALAEKTGPVDVLVNNAGVVVCNDTLAMPESDYRRMMDVNYFGQIWMMQAYVPAMIAAGGGRVVNMCSSAGKIGVANLSGYCASKFAAVGFSDSIRPELKKTGVRFTIVNPGYVNTGMFQGSKVPLFNRWQEPGAIADAMVRAVMKNKAEVCVPNFWVRFATFMRGLCVPRITDLAASLLGGHRSFQSWQKDDTRPF